MVDGLLIRNTDGSRSELEQAVALLNSGLGEGYYTLNQMSDALLNEKGSFLLVAMLNADLAGVFFGEVSRPDNESPVITKVRNAGFVLPTCYIGLMRGLLVSAKYRNAGVGNALFVSSITEFVKRDVHCLVGTLWNHPQNAVKTFFLNNGFAFLGQVTRFWWADSVQYQFACPVCGNPCQCSASIYLKQNIEAG